MLPLVDNKMEQYRVLQRLGKGAQGSVYSVENRIEGKKYVLKKVECKDEGEANRAFKEAMALKELHHAYICGFKEFFVHWDSEDSAIYFCMIIEHYEKGDLSSVLRMKRLKRDAVDETLVKKWFGEVTEALLYVHKNGIIHRDLKPGNLFLKNSMDVCVGDFGVATVMCDARSNTRASVGTLIYMSPELSLGHGYTEKSDAWAVGCILLETVTCSILDADHMIKLLQDVKTSESDSLDKTLQQVAQIYGNEVVTILQSLLTVDPERRPTLKELLCVGYVQECVNMVDTEIIEKKKKQKSAGLSRTVLPVDQGLDAVLSHLRLVINCPDKTLETLSYLNDLLSRDQSTQLDALGKVLITEAMVTNLSDIAVQTTGLAILNSIVTQAKPGDIIFSEDVVTVIAKVLKAHWECSELVETVSNFILALSADESAAEILGAQGVIAQLLSMLVTFNNNTSLCASVCHTIWSLAVFEKNTRILSEENGLETICNTLSSHLEKPEVVEATAACLLSLSMEDDSVCNIGKLDTVSLLVRAMESHSNNAKVVKNSCLALASFVELDEESAFKVLACENLKGEEVSGLPILLAAYSVHKDNADVVEAICTLLMELAEYEEVHRELNEQNVRSLVEKIHTMFTGNKEIKVEMNYLRFAQIMLAEVQKRFKENKNISVPCKATLAALEPAQQESKFSIPATEVSANRQ